MADENGCEKNVINPLEESFHEVGQCLLCPTCGNNFKTRSGLNRHIKKHEKTEEYPCEKCHKRYGIKSDLLAHMRAKHGKTKILCPYCSVSFTHRSALARHKAVSCAQHQTKEDNILECDICGYKTARKDSLKMHIQATHERISRYRCIPCGKSYRWRSGLAFHNVHHHSSCTRPM